MTTAQLDVAFHAKVGGTALDIRFCAAGALVALFGRSGAGKSLTLAHLAGLMRPSAGRIKVGETTFFDSESRIDLPAHRRRVGLVFQDAQLFPHLSVKSNLLFGRRFHGGAEERVALSRVVDTLGLAPLLQRFPNRLSGGERQRVAIGRALLAAPRLLLLDEPLAALDRQRKLEILPLIEALRDEFRVPIVYVSHSLAEVTRLAAMVVVLENGRVSRVGHPAEVLGAVPDANRFDRLSVVPVTVGERDRQFGLTALDHHAGRLWVLGAPGRLGETVAAVVRATDVTLATEPMDGLSVQSRLSGVVGAIELDGPLAAVEVILGNDSVTAFVTRRALSDLRLVRGAKVTALIKAVALDEAALPPGFG